MVGLPPKRLMEIRPLPNAWLQAILGRRPAPHDWFALLAYSKMAEHFGNSSEGYFGPIPCWACSLGEVEDISDPAFRGVFLTQKGGLGYLNQGHLLVFATRSPSSGLWNPPSKGLA